MRKKRVTERGERVGRAERERCDFWIAPCETGFGGGESEGVFKRNGVSNCSKHVEVRVGGKKGRTPSSGAQFIVVVISHRTTHDIKDHR